ncbi:hypothetical protein [Nocardia tenerifensis]|uniref:hypothetical protein n=1 Tax=Nocardia tenerifensis TaxID=228006 RepID=UPI001B86FCDB|nr:hypothetical protein [Nocardia tenerifensis]
MVTRTAHPRSVPEERSANGIVWLAAWPVMAVFVLSNAATPLYVVWQRELGFSSGTLTAIFASYIAGLLGALLVAGVVSDRVGRKPVLLPLSRWRRWPVCCSPPRARSRCWPSRGCSPGSRWARRCRRGWRR